MMVDAKAKECPICQYEFAVTSKWLKWGAIALTIALLYLFLR